MTETPTSPTAPVATVPTAKACSRTGPNATVRAGQVSIGVGDRLSRKDIRTAIDLGRGSMPKFDHLSELERIAIVRYVLTAGDDFTVDDRTTEVGHVFADPTTLRDPDGLPGNAPPWGTLSAINIATAHC